MYKLTKLDGTDFYSGTINYAENIGKIIRIKDYDGPEKVCGRGIHLSRTPNDCFIGAKIPCRAFKVNGIQRIAGDKQKTRYQAVKVLHEIEDLNMLFGWNYNEAINPIHPFKITPPVITDKHIALVREWDSVKGSVWDSVEYSVWRSVGNLVEYSVGNSVWDSVGDSVGDSVWNSVGDSVWNSVGDSVWYSFRDSVGGSVWDSVGDSVKGSIYAYMGSFFYNIKEWRHIKHKKGIYPFQSAVNLWKMGLVPSFDRSKWRLHGGKDGSVLWEGKV